MAKQEPANEESANRKPKRADILWVPRSMLTRRNFLLGTAGAAFLTACGSSGSGGDTATGSTPAGDAAGSTPAAEATTGGAASEVTAQATMADAGSEIVAGPTTAAATDAKTGGTLRVGLVGSTNDIVDGQYIVTKADQARLLAGWEPLVSYDSQFNVTYENALAEEIETKAADHYVIRLKEGLLFSNGQPVTADDVIYSFNRRLDPDLNLAPSLPALLDANGMSKVDDRTVEFKLLQPAVTFVNGLAEYTATIVPDGYKREDTEQVGTGPFMMKSFTPGSESVHVKNPNYWGEGLPYLDEVQIIDFADAQALVNALQSGQVDCAVDIPFAQAQTIGSTEGLNILNSQAGNWLTITMAIDQTPFDDVRVRQAMRLIVNREEMVQRVLSGYGTIGNDMYGRLDSSYPSDFPQREQDIEQAKKLLADAGQSDLEIDLFAPDDTAGLPELATAFAEQAKEAGITVNAKVLDGGEYWGDQYTKRTFATSFWSTRPYLNQVAAGALKDATYPETHWPPEGSNFTDLYYQALAETDDDKRKEIIREMQKEEYDDGGWMIPVFNNLVDGYADYVKGLVEEPNLLNLDHYGRGYKNIWLDQ